MKIKSFLISIFSLVMLAGCQQAKEVAQDIKAHAENPEIMGKWAQEKCVNTDYFGSPIKATRKIYEFVGTKFTETEEFYSNPDCTEAAGNFTYHGHFKVGDPVNGQIRELTLNYDEAVITPTNDTGREILNALNFCSKKDWAVNQSVNRSAQSQDTLCPLYSVPTVRNDVFLVENGKMFFGPGSHKAKGKPDSRPNDIDRSSHYMKQ